MKRILTVISIIVLASATVLISVNAQNARQDKKKCTTEASAACCKKDGDKGACCHMKYGSSGNATAEDGKKCAKKDCCNHKCADKDGKQVCDTLSAARK
jgi:hypothetical protein